MCLPQLNQINYSHCILIKKLTPTVKIKQGYLNKKDRILFIHLCSPETIYDSFFERYKELTTKNYWANWSKNQSFHDYNGTGKETIYSSTTNSTMHANNIRFSRRSWFG